MYYVYILYSHKLEKRYIGYTSDLKRRIEEHNQNSVPFTSKGSPWQLIYYEAFHNKQDAQAEERFLKSGRGRDRLAHLLRHTLSDMNYANC